MTSEITARLFADEWHRHTNGLFYPGPHGQSLNGADFTALVKSFLRILEESATTYLQSRSAGAPNYEHFFSLAKTIEGQLALESLDPAFGDFVERIGKQTQHLWERVTEPSWSGTLNDRLATLAQESQVFIESAVRSQLTIGGTPVGFDALLALLNDKDDFEHIDVVTLNHDLLLDRLMQQAGIDYHDGFSIRDGDVRLFDRDACSDTSRVHLIKPHGAIDWHRFRRIEDDSSLDCHGIPDQGTNAWHAKQADGKWYRNLSGNPSFLTGIDKNARYATGIFGQQVSWFRYSLERTDRIVCSGYGWRDTGIN